MNKTVTLIFYIFIFFISILNLHFSEKTTNYKLKKFLIFMSLFPLWFINIFRANIVGTDHLAVGNQYSKIVLHQSMSGYNWFWLPLSTFCKVIGFIFGPNYFWFYLVLGTLFVIYLYKFIINNCQNKVASLFLFIVFGLYLQSFNQTRQVLALVIILYSMKYLNGHNKFKYFFSILCASVFHESALIFLPLYFIKNININSKKSKYMYLIATIIILFFNTIIIRIISFTKYYIYFSSQYNIEKVSSTIINLFVRILLLIFCIYNLDKEKIQKRDLYNFSYHMVIICTLLQLLAIKFYFFARITTYFYAFYIYLLPICINNFLKKFDPNKRTIFFILITLILFMYFFVYYFSSSGASGSGYEIYKFAFSKE